MAIQLETSGVQFEYEKLKLPYTISHNYVPDFVLASGVIIEAKGYFRTAAEPLKMRAVKAAYPDLDIRFIFWDANKKVLRTKTTHGEWATKFGFPWSNERFPEDWLT